MNKLYIVLCMIPVGMIVAIFMLISKKHSDNPDRLSCTSFESALSKTVKLYVSKPEFSKSMAHICHCFKQNHLNGKSKDFVTKESLDVCAKPIVYEWITADGKKGVGGQQENCFKEAVYQEIILPHVLKELAITHQSGFIRNDLFDYQTSKRDQISLIYKKCYR